MSPASPAASPLGPLQAILAHLNSRPSRTWSIVVTIYGDAVVPRGGSLWLGTLLEFFRGMEIGDGVVRTAMSRLAADGWLERQRVGRNSFYRLAGKGSEMSLAAAHRIYHSPTETDDLRFNLVLATQGGTRPVLEEAGFGSAAQGVWVAPLGVPVPELLPTDILMQAGMTLESGRRLTQQAWKLDQTANAYQRFLAAFSPLRVALQAGLELSDLDALVARILLVHEYRRVVLRDPLLPQALMPATWPGRSARALCGDLYRTLLPASERWLDQHAVDQEGPLPAPGPELERRFQA